MKLRLFSDLHLEFEDFRVPELSDDATSVLILAGDVQSLGAGKLAYGRFKAFWEDVSARFKEVIYVAGNHESYGTSLLETPRKIQDLLDEASASNVRFLNRGTFEVDGVVFIGATLWTDIGGAKTPEEANRYASFMNDFRTIRMGPESEPYLRRFSPWESAIIHRQDVAYIQKEILRAKDAGKRVVVVTHHGPSYQASDSIYEGSPYNRFYYSDLEGMIEETRPEYWLHGHTHIPRQFEVGATKVILNPRGYPMEDSVSDTGLRFNPELVIEI